MCRLDNTDTQPGQEGGVVTSAVFPFQRPDWIAQANCRGLAVELFFPERGVSTTEAKQVCAACTVRTECLDYALTNYERWGTWGGKSERQRRHYRSELRVVPS